MGRWHGLAGFGLKREDERVVVREGATGRLGGGAAQASPERLAVWAGWRAARRGLLGAVVALSPFFVSAPASAQSSRDAQFCDTLFRAGFGSLAESEARRIEGSPSYPVKVRGDAGYLLVRILKQKAQVASGSRAQDLLQEVAKLIDELKQKYPNNEASAVADLEKLQTRLREADAKLQAAEDTEDPKQRTALNDQAVTIYQGALAGFDTVIAQIQSRLDKTPTDDLEFKRDLSEYLRANAYLSYAQALKQLGRGEERQGALENALKQLSAFFDERTTFFNLWTLAFLGQGKTLIELGRYDKASELLDMAQDIEAPGSPDPNVLRQQQQFVRDVRAEAAYWMLLAAVKAGKHQQAVDAFARYKQEHPDYLDTHFGKFAVFEYGKALAGLGQLRAGGEAIGEVLERSKHGKLVPGYDIDAYGVSACKALAEMSASSKGFLPAELQYRAGQGFFFKREFERATYALKGVLASSASETEQERWGSKALLDLGAAYQFMERYYEAALAYQGLYRMFPEDDRASTAMKHAKQMFDLLAKKDRWYQALSDEVTSDQQELLSGVSAERSKYGQAVEWQKQRRYQQAARKFLEVKEQVTERSGKKRLVPFYGESLANAGYCFYLAAQKAKGPVGEQARRQATETLGRALAYGKEHNQPSAWAAAAYFQSLILGSDAEKKYEAALSVLAAFDGPLKEQTGYLSRAYAQSITCLVKLDRLEEAEARMDTLLERFSSASQVSMAALELGQAYASQADGLMKEEKFSEALARLRSASRHIALWAKRSPRLSFNGAVWAGDILFRAGEFEQARTVLARGFERAKSRDALPEEDRKALVYESAQLQYARALLALHRLPDAVKVLEAAKAGYEAEGQTPLEDFGFAYAYAEAVYRRWVEAERPESDVLQVKAAHEAYWTIIRQIDEDKWPTFLREYGLGTVPYFRAKLEADARKLEIDLAMKAWGRVKFAVDQLEKQGWLDDQLDLADGTWVSGRIVEERADGTVVVMVSQKKREIPKTKIKGIDRFPADLRKRFFRLRAQAISDGGLR